jgi:hypothetical protein
MSAPKYSVLQVRPAKDSLTGQGAFVEFLASLKSSLKSTFFNRLLGNYETICLEIVNLNQTTFFIISCPERLEHLVRSQVAAQYPTALITPMKDYLPDWLNHGESAVGQLVLTGPSHLALNITEDDKVDQMAATLGSLSRIPAGNAAIIQICLFAAPKNWQKAVRGVLNRGIPSSDPLKPAAPHPQKMIIEKKLTYQAFSVDIRLCAITPQYDTSKQLLSQVAAAFGTYALSEGNSLALKIPKFPSSLPKLRQMILERTARYSNQYQYLNYGEIAALYHLPGALLAPIRGIAWGKTLKGEAPTNLPVDEGIPENERHLYNFFAKTEYKNHLAVFGMKKGIDRLRHTYILGKSGTGKSTLIGRMAINDIQHGEGIAFVDPHGDAAEILLDYIPENRIEDVAYLDPSVPGKSFWLNPLYVKNAAQGEMVASSIVSIFSKLYGNSWGPRLEYILRNTLLTLVYKPETTLADVPRILTNKEFREKECLIHVTDPVLVNFWRDEYDKYSEKFQTEAIAPILNKVGQFVTSPTIRDIINHPKSTVDFEDMMNSGKIVILNLPQGKIGEDNAALLGAMFISQIQIAAMNRANMEESKRRDFFLYVDEFQNFATSSFVKILSEARKYRLGLILANQYIAQLPEEIQNAIFGNVGTVMSYVVGASDADRIMKELNNLYTADDLVGLGKYQLAMKMSIESQMSQPFSSYALPLPDTYTHQKEKVLASTYEKYYRETKPMDMAQVTAIMTPAAKRFTENQDSRPDYRTQPALSPVPSTPPVVASFGTQNRANLTPQPKAPYTPQLPPIPPRTQPNPYKIPPSSSSPAVGSDESSRPNPIVTPHPPLAEGVRQSQPPRADVVPPKEPTLEELDELRKQGLRPSVVGCFLNDNKENLNQAFFRELGEEITEDFVSNCDKNIKLITVDKIEFPPSKQGLRDLVTDAGESVVMKGKYYYFCLTNANNPEITIGATEFEDYKWLNFDEAYKLIKETNTGGKLRTTSTILHLLKDQGLLSSNQPKSNGPESNIEARRPNDSPRELSNPGRDRRDSRGSFGERKTSNSQGRSLLRSTPLMGPRYVGNTNESKHTIVPGEPQATNRPPVRTEYHPQQPDSFSGKSSTSITPDIIAKRVSSVGTISDDDGET